ncbi:N-acetylneuraminate synthase [archaeon]|jgi:N-acetylneuraminate synthase|nr:N-acetylneuraminate synthase [archaeon]MBT4647055.1 N-acetylneuraminate synthase [archaeon]MBT6820964.1 N-acetylneuraminate synthase [archaeon]MBT7392156.1 N-acetylneuraminate synthase [archaeon]
MPKEGYDSVTLPNVLVEDIDKYVEESNKLVSGKPEAIKIAWLNFRQNKFNIESIPKKEKKVKIGNKWVGKGFPTLIIAEIGINHNGDLEIAKKLIDTAVDCGCDAVKFQKREPEICVPKHERDKIRETPWGTMTYFEYKKKIEFGQKEFEEIDKYCKEKGMLWFASCWDKPSVDFIDKFNPPCYKIASASLTDEELVKYTASKGKPMIISTGMSTIEEIKNTVNILDIDNLIIMHCTSTYPSKHEELNLNVIPNFRERFDCPIGYSGHEVGLPTTVAAVALGATSIERHITLDKSMWGTDHGGSVDPYGFMLLVKRVRAIERALGDGIKKVYESEIPIRNKLRSV